MTPLLWRNIVPALWERKQGVRVSVSTMSRAIVRLGWTLKKRVWVPPKETKRREVLGENA